MKVLLSVEPKFYEVQDGTVAKDRLQNENHQELVRNWKEHRQNRRLYNSSTKNIGYFLTRVCTLGLLADEEIPLHSPIAASSPKHERCSHDKSLEA